MDLTTGIDRYLRHHRVEGSSAKIHDWHALSPGQFAAHMRAAGHGPGVADPRADDPRDHIDQLRDRGLAPSSIATKARSIKAWGKWLVAEDYVGRDPFGGVEQPRVDDEAKEALTLDEADRLLATCDRQRLTGARDFAHMPLPFGTGLRAGEALGLCPADIDRDTGLIVVRRGKGANSAWCRRGDRSRRRFPATSTTRSDGDTRTPRASP